MISQHTVRRHLPHFSGVIAIAAAVLLLPLARPAAAQQVTMKTLLDRIQIQDLMTRYYYDLSHGNHKSLSEYFTQDAMLDVDGTVAHGPAEIMKLYEGPNGSEQPKSSAPKPQNHVLLTNPIIEIHGNTATAHVIWTTVQNDGITKPPRITEQGREDSELVKRNGKWLIKKRYISSDGRLPNRFDKTFKQRDDPLKDTP
jgi:hypothetical protein